MDRDLVEQARRGDREAFAVLVHQVSDSLYAVAHRILRDSALAEDALQNALVLAWRRLPHLREPDRFEAWIHRILVHACYDESQRARQWTANVRVLPLDGPTTPDGTAVIADRDELERAFRRLPIDQRAVFVLHHYLGLPLVEIAEMLEIPAGTARSRLHYATRGLRDALMAERGARGPGRTSRMTDDRSLERAARSWLETGPTEAPDRAVEAALLRIQTTPQERDLRIPWRLPTMTTPARVAAAAVIGVLVGRRRRFLVLIGRSIQLACPWHHRAVVPSTKSSAPSSSASIPAGAQIDGRIQVGQPVAPRWFASDGQSLWVHEPSSLVRVDLATSAITGQVPTNPMEYGYVTTGAGAVWQTDCGRDAS